MKKMKNKEIKIKEINNLKKNNLKKLKKQILIFSYFYFLLFN